VAPFGLAFGISATDAGLRPWETIAFSAFVFGGSAQFAAVDVMGDGGAALSAVVAGLLLNLRCLAYGVVMAPSLRGPWWKRALWSQVMVDQPAALGAAQSDPDMARYAYLVCGTYLFIFWNIATVVGALALPTAGDIVTDWGLDAGIPAVFLALLWPRLRQSDQRRTAGAGAASALALTPVTPAGLPVGGAAFGAVAGWRSRSTSGEPEDEADDENDADEKDADGNEVTEHEDDRL
jgi:predicted branched-subunit amino acid permease